MSTNHVADSSNLPIKSKLTFAYAISIVIAVLMTAVSIAGLLSPQIIYPTAELVEAFVPNDVVNLLIGLPILLGSMWLTWRGKLIGLLLWPGALFYVFYTYIVYIFGMPLNLAFLFHLTLVAMSVYTLVGLLASISADPVKNHLAGSVRERFSAGVLVVLSTLFFVRASYLLVDAILNQSPLPPTEIALVVTDFLIAPVWVIGGVLLWRREAFGYVTGLGLLFQASMLFIGLIVILIVRPFITTAQFVILDVLVILIMGMVCFIPLILFARSVVSNKSMPSA